MFKIQWKYRTSSCENTVKKYWNEFDTWSLGPFLQKDYAKYGTVGFVLPCSGCFLGCFRVVAYKPSQSSPRLSAFWSLHMTWVKSVMSTNNQNLFIKYKWKWLKSTNIKVCCFLLHLKRTLSQLVGGRLHLFTPSLPVLSFHCICFLHLSKCTLIIHIHTYILYPSNTHPHNACTFSTFIRGNTENRSWCQ